MMPVKRETRYLNTDLDLVADHSLDAITAALASGGIFSLNEDNHENGRWHETWETKQQFSHPEPNMVCFLTAIESFDAAAQQLWMACDSRELNIGYDCGDQPWAFNHLLTAATLARMAALNISLRITLYLARDPKSSL